MDLEEASHHPGGPGQPNTSEMTNLKKTVEQQRKNLEDLKQQLDSKEKALLELDKQLKQVRLDCPVHISCFDPLSPLKNNIARVPLVYMSKIIHF